MFKYLFLCLLLVPFSQALHAFEDIIETPVPIESNGEFSYIGDQRQMELRFRPLKEELRSIEALSTANAVGVIHIGKIKLNEPSTALNAMRAIAVQISKTLNLDMALVTDSKTSSQLAPHELLLLYHPNIVITLVLTRSVDADQYDLIGTYAISKSAG